MDDCYKLKTIGNSKYYHTESENPILKLDEHHAEIFDCVDGLVVKEASFLNSEYELENHEVLKKDIIWDAFSKAKW